MCLRRVLKTFSNFVFLPLCFLFVILPRPSVKSHSDNISLSSRILRNMIFSPNSSSRKQSRNSNKRRSRQRGIKEKNNVLHESAMHNLAAMANTHGSSLSEKHCDNGECTSAARCANKWYKKLLGNSKTGKNQHAQELDKKTETEHPLRTDEWEISYYSCFWSPYPLHSILSKYLLKEGHYCSSLQRHQQLNCITNNKTSTAIASIRFHRNGFCKVTPGGEIFHSAAEGADSETRTTTIVRIHPHIGRWKLSHGSVHWDVPITILIDKSQENLNTATIAAFTTLHFVADVHLNRFGHQPRMFKGVISRDRISERKCSSFLRPIIGTFVANGVGQDTLDNTYKKRAMGLIQTST